MNMLLSSNLPQIKSEGSNILNLSLKILKRKKPLAILQLNTHTQQQQNARKDFVKGTKCLEALERQVLWKLN